MTAEPEFSRAVRIDTLGATPRPFSIDADEAERAALARRFGLVAIGSLDAEAALTRRGDEVIAEGRLRSNVTQSCVATGAPVEARVEEPFRIVFRPVPAAGGAEEEIELSEGELDVTFYEGALVDVGEGIAETLSLSLDPYPRAPDAAEALRRAGVKSEAEERADSSPFAVLRALKGDG